MGFNMRLSYSRLDYYERSMSDIKVLNTFHQLRPYSTALRRSEGLTGEIVNRDLSSIILETPAELL